MTEGVYRAFCKKCGETTAHYADRHCVTCSKKSASAWNRAHPEERAANARAYHAAHREERAAYYRVNGAAYRAAHKEILATGRRQRRAEGKLEALGAYGGPVCVCCGETLIEGLTLDHVNGNGAEHRRECAASGELYKWLKRNNYPPGYQVLCMTCNFAKGTGDHCPHRDVAP